jgi:hypothetical protein
VKAPLTSDDAHSSTIPSPYYDFRIYFSLLKEQLREVEL